jgi:hypothetical protein
MNIALCKYPLEFIIYALNDISLLLQILDRKIYTYNKILRDTLGIDAEDAYFTRKTLPLTQGSIINEIWHRFFLYIVFKNDNTFICSLNKMSLINPLSLKYQENKEFLQFINAQKSLADFRANL